MRIAVTYENGEIFQHFGHTEQFKLYDVEEGKIVSAQVVDSNGNGHGALAGVLSALGVDALIRRPKHWALRCRRPRRRCFWCWNSFFGRRFW